MSSTGNGQNLWLNDILLQAFLRNGFAQTNGTKSWELTELQYLGLTDDLAKGFLSFASTNLYRKQFFELEVELIKQKSKIISDSIETDAFNLIDIYCGDGLKAVEFIKEFNVNTGGNVKINYCPLNSSQYLIDLAISNVKKASFSNVAGYKPYLSSGDGRALRSINDNLKSGEFNKNVVLILGGVLACFEINEYLFELNRDLKEGDVLIFGNGIRVGERLVNIEKYKDPAFQEWFKHLMFGLGFEDKDIEFDARFGNSRIEFVYKINKDLSQKINGKAVDFKKGDEFVVAALYKYYAEEFEKFCKMYFKNPQIFTDKDNEYALVVCKK